MTDTPELPKLPAKPLPISGYASTYSGFQLDDYGRECFEAGRASRAQSEPVDAVPGEPVADEATFDKAAA